ncbi:MAG: ABC transporter ATP-binding protein, partial [Gemmatimonadetes bacterium]|nr:ABC transporter ATP-binding protein [Gemmatimonadota bacterium]
AMLYQGQIRQVAPVDQFRRTHDPIIRQFLDGRPEAAGDAELGGVEAAR